MQIRDIGWHGLAKQRALADALRPDQDWDFVELAARLIGPLHRAEEYELTRPFGQRRPCDLEHVAQRLVQARDAVPLRQLLEVVKKWVVLAIVKKRIHGVVEGIAAPGQRLRPPANVDVEIPCDFFAHHGEPAFAHRDPAVVILKAQLHPLGAPVPQVEPHIQEQSGENDGQRFGVFARKRPVLRSVRQPAKERHHIGCRFRRIREHAHGPIYPQFCARAQSRSGLRLRFTSRARASAQPCFDLGCGPAHGARSHPYRLRKLAGAHQSIDR